MKSEDFKPEISFYGEVPLPPNVRPVLLLKGSNFDMGYQFYQELVHIFGPWYLNGIARNDFTKEEFAALKAYQYYTKKYTPELIDMMKGMAEGATDAGVPMTYKAVLALCTGTNSYPGAPPESKREKLEEDEGCSGWAAWGSTTTDGSLVCGGSTDHEYKCEFTYVAFPEEGGNNFIISSGSPTLGGHPAMNNKSLAYVHHGSTHWIKSKPVEKYTYGVKEGFAVLHTLRFADNAAEAEKMQWAYPSGDGFVGGFWVDAGGNAFVIESRDNPKVIRRSGDYGETDFLYATNNAMGKELGHCQPSDPKLGVDKNVYFEHGGWCGSSHATISSVQRNLGLWNMLHNYKGEVDIKFGEMMWRFAGKKPDYPTLEEAEAAYYKTLGEGWDSHMCYSLNHVIANMLPDNGNEGLYCVTDGCPARVTWPARATIWEPFSSGHTYRIAPTYSFYELKLTSSPKEVLVAAKRRAQYDLYDANRELVKLDYKDVAYAPLEEIFNEAVSEWDRGLWYEGEWQVNSPARAANSTGNEYVYYVAKALRGFTRCQALAKKVYQALVPPATCPEDLGLPAWFGNWGEWAKQISTSPQPPIRKK